MNESYLLLERSIESALKVIEELLEDLPGHPLADDTPDDVLVIQGYRLHNLFTAFEHLLHNVAMEFESRDTVDSNPAVWDEQLLNRMSLDLSPLRPAVIDDEVHEQLGELARFRRYFRSTYSNPLDPERLNLALRRGRELRESYPPVIDRFLEFLRAG
jgi:hypothetical protein